MSIRKTSSDPSAGVQGTPATPQSKESQSKESPSPQGSHGSRSITEDSPKPKIPRDRTPTNVTRLSDRAIQQLKDAIIASNKGDLTPLKEWCNRHAIKAVDPRTALMQRDLVSEDREGNLIYKPLQKRKVRKDHTDHATVLKAAVNAAKKAPSVQMRQKPGGSSVKNAHAPMGKKRRKSNQSDELGLDGDSAVVSTPSEAYTNPLMSVNRKDKEEGPDGVKADHVDIPTQKGQ